MTHRKITNNGLMSEQVGRRENIHIQGLGLNPTLDFHIKSLCLTVILPPYGKEICWMNRQGYGKMCI